MSSDNDKTVFKPRGGGSPDQTIIRPTPGRRGAPAPQPAARTAPGPAPMQGRGGYTDLEASYMRLSSGLNPLVNAASTLVAVLEKTRNTLSHPDVGGLYQRLTNEIRAFQNRLQELNIKQEIAVSARYILCSALDEMVLNTPWGAESQWAQKTLLTVFHNETSGGEKFFQILDRMRQAPAENLDMLELMYILISLGFEGRYRIADRGRDALEQLRDELFAIIRSYRGEYERDLSPQWQGLGKTRNSLAEYLPMWVVASLMGAVLVLSYSGFRYWLYDTSVPVVTQLTEIVEPEETPEKKTDNR